MAENVPFAAHTAPVPRLFDIVGFDLDGTLIDTSGDLLAAVNHVLADVGRPLLREEEIRPMIGGGAKHMLALGLKASGGVSDAEFRPLYKQMLRYYAANICVYSRPFPGAVEAMDALAEQSVTLAVVTNKFESLATDLLEQLGLLSRFETVIGGDTLGPGNAKPSAAPIHEMIARCGGGRAVFIGDSIYDIMAAKAAGIPSIAVGFGFLDGPVEELGADAVIDGWGELVGVLNRLS
ncbi:MAG: HAD-IA family hydrolase [Sphingomonas sp.]